MDRSSCGLLIHMTPHRMNSRKPVKRTAGLTDRRTDGRQPESLGYYSLLYVIGALIVGGSSADKNPTA